MDRDIEKIKFKNQVFDVDFHPTTNVVAIGLITGVAACYQYSPQGNKCVVELRNHQDACRATRFSTNGTCLYTASSDRAIYAVSTEGGATIWRKKKAHKAPINSLKPLSEHVLATGDDNGTVKIWDTRQEKATHTVSTNTDFISDIAVHQNNLLLTSGDGTLAVVHWRTGQVKGQSVCMDDELLSVAVLKDGKKVVCGSQDGVLDIFNADEWGDISDRFPGHPSSVESLVVIDESTLCTAASDSLIRVVSIHPNKLLGVVGEHSEYPVERIALSGDKQYLASASHDKTVKFWDVAYLFEDDDVDDDDDDDSNMDGAMEVEGHGGASAAVDSKRSRKSRGKEKEGGSFFDAM